MLFDVFLDGVPARARSRALFEQIRTAIASGRLAGGDRLPPSRDLAAELGIARSTVATVYAHLIADGYCDARVGDGTFVARHHDAGRRRRPETTWRTSAIAVMRPVAPTDSSSATPPGGWAIDLRAGRPDPRLFPLAEWRQAVARTLRSPPPGYGDPAGLPDLRAALASWIARSRGVEVTDGQILVTAGAQGAFDLCARTLIKPGALVAVENPGYAPARAVFQLHGARLVATPVDHDGIVVDRIPRRTRAVLVTPSHQAPSGAVLSSSRRQQLLELAAAGDMVIIEDDYDTEYRYVDRPLEPLHRLDTTGRVMYIGSFSKTLTPSLRIGFLVAPAPVVDELTRTRQLVDTQPPHLVQAALAIFITSGDFDRHLRRTRRVYRARRDCLNELLDRLVDDGVIATHAGCNAGLHTTITLHPGTDAETIAGDLQHDRIAIATTTSDWIGRSQHPALVVGFGLAGPDELSRAASALRKRLAPRPRP